MWDATETRGSYPDTSEAIGKARVTIYHLGADVQLSDVKCYGSSPSNSFCH